MSGPLENRRIALGNPDASRQAAERTTPMKLLSRRDDAVRSVRIVERRSDGSRLYYRPSAFLGHRYTVATHEG